MMLANLKAASSYVLPLFLRPARLLRAYDRSCLQPDLTAGITVAVVLLPQAIAFALIAGLPPKMGLYTAVVAAIIGALWGSSSQIHNGPTSALSLLVLSVASGTAATETREFIVAAGLLAVMVGILQLVMGLARLGMLVNFVSDSVIVGFAAGAGVQIAVGQLSPLFGLEFQSRDILDTLEQIATRLPETHIPTFVLGTGTILLILLLRQLKPELPASLISLIGAALILFVLGLDERGVQVLGRLPSTLPPLADVPLLNRNLISQLSTGALAIAAIGLIQTIAVAKSLAAESGERLDSNQEFIGQGLANIACGFFSGFPVSGSFSRSAVNAKAGAETPVAAVFSGIFVLIAMLALAPLAAYLPRAALAGVLIVVAYGMVDRQAMTRIIRGDYGEAAIMAVTLLGTVFLPIEFAVLAGIIMSLGYYILQTSAPQVHSVLPTEDFTSLKNQPEEAQCPQLGILDIHGDLYFGAVSHVENAIRAHQAKYDQRFLLLRMHGVNHCDFSGIRMLEGIVRTYREQGGDVFMTRVRDPVLRFMKSTNFYRYLGQDHFLDKDDAIEYLFYRVLDPAICIYETDVRVFQECQNLPRPDYPVEIPVYTDIPVGHVPTMSPQELWKRLHDDKAPLVIDVREPREFKQGHVPEAELIPFPTLLTGEPNLPRDRTVVLTCRGGRRSIRAAWLLHQAGYDNVVALEGGTLAWEAADLLEAVE